MENDPLAIKQTSERLKITKLEAKKAQKKKAHEEKKAGRAALLLETKAAPSPETDQPPAGLPAPEHIGHVLVAGANPETIAAKPKPEKPSQQPVTDKRIETMGRSQLLELSKQITIDGSTLHQIYETHLVGERGLRRLVAEHMRGGDAKKALQREIVEREIDFERDPVLRDMTLAAYPSAAALSSDGIATDNKATLDKLLEQAGQQLPASNEQAAFIKARANYESQQLDLRHKQRRLIDLSLIAAIAGLLVLVLILFITRR